MLSNFFVTRFLLLTHFVHVAIWLLHSTRISSINFSLAFWTHAADAIPTQGGCCTNSLLLNEFLCTKTSRLANDKEMIGVICVTYGVEEHKALINHLQRWGQLFVVLVELADDLLRLLLRQLNQKTLICFHVEGSDVQVTLVCRDLY